MLVYDKNTGIQVKESIAADEKKIRLLPLLFPKASKESSFITVNNFLTAFHAAAKECLTMYEGSVMIKNTFQQDVIVDELGKSTTLIENLHIALTKLEEGKGLEALSEEMKEIHGEIEISTK